MGMAIQLRLISFYAWIEIREINDLNLGRSKTSLFFYIYHIMKYYSQDLNLANLANSMNVALGQWLRSRFNQKFRSGALYLKR